MPRYIYTYIVYYNILYFIHHVAAQYRDRFLIRIAFWPKVAQRQYRYTATAIANRKYILLFA